MLNGVSYIKDLALLEDRKLHLPHVINSTVNHRNLFVIFWFKYVPLLFWNTCVSWVCICMYKCCVFEFQYVPTYNLCNIFCMFLNQNYLTLLHWGVVTFHHPPSFLLSSGTVFSCCCNISTLPTESCSCIPGASPFLMTFVKMPCLISCFTWTSIAVSLTKGTPAALSVSEKPKNFFLVSRFLQALRFS